MRMGVDVPDVVLGEFDTSYLQMLSEKAGESEESHAVQKMVDNLLESHSLLTLRKDV